MKYTDYNTGGEISRAQYIANGLERGELLIKENCGCMVIQDRTAGAYIVYCEKHEAAPDMYEALKKIQKWLLFDVKITDPNNWNEQFVKANDLTAKALAKALAKADGN